MKKGYTKLTISLGFFLIFADISAQDTLKVSFTGMTPHLNQNLYFRVIDVTDNSELSRTIHKITSPDFALTTVGIIPGNSYQLDFFADLNQNGKYDPPPIDHAWRIPLYNVQGDTTIQFTHNTNFTDIMWKYKLTVNFSGMYPHIGQPFYLYVRNPVTHESYDSASLSSIPEANFTLTSYAITPGNDYDLDFYADLNTNNRYDSPPLDHAYRINLSNVQGDTVVNFEHNGNFTDIGLNITELNENTASHTIEAFPNPVQNTLHLNFDLLIDNVRIRIYDLTGVLLSDKIYYASGNTMDIDMSQYKRGIYLLRSTLGSTNDYVKITKE